MAEQNVGKVVAIIGPVLDIEFPEGKLPAIYNAVQIQDDGKTTGEKIDVIAEVAQQLGESVARCVSMKPTDGMVRGMTGRGPRRADFGARRPGDARPHPERHRRPDRRPGPGEGQGALADPPRAAGVRRAGDLGRDVRNRHQGHRPARAVHEGRQDRPLRRRGRRQDRHDPGAHQQRRHAPRRLLGLLRRGRAHPRGQRPLPRDDGVGRHHAGRHREVQGRADLRPDDRAARARACASASPV